MKAKKLLFLALATLMLLGCMSITAFAENEPWANGDTPENNKIFYTATAEVKPRDKSSYNESDSVYDDISQKGIMVFNSAITDISDNDFCSKYDLTSIILPSSVTSVGDGAFYDCTALTGISMPEVETIDDNAFGCCELLTSAYMPEVETVGEHAFEECYALESISMPKVQTVGSAAFSCCSSLITVYMPKITAIERCTFYECTYLESVSAPLVTSIGDIAFCRCENMTSVYMPEVTTLGVDVFVGCEALKYIYAPSNLAESLDDYDHYSVTISAPHGNVAISDTDFDVVSGCVNYVKYGMYPTLTVTPDDLYKLNKIEYTDSTGTTDITQSKQFTMPDEAITVTATFENNGCYLDLEITATYPDTKNDITQPYTLTQEGATTYTDVTKVKVEWTLPEISASFSLNKTWNPDTLSWVETKTTSTISQKQATFTFTNYSSVTVGAKVSFAKAIGTDANPYASEVLTLKSKVVNATGDREVYYTKAPSGTITHTYTPTAADFNSQSAGNGTYGTYTIKLVSALKVVFDMNGKDATAISDEYVGNGGKLTAPTAPTATGFTFDGWYKEAGCTNAWNFDTDTVTETKTLYAKWVANELKTISFSSNHAERTDNVGDSVAMGTQNVVLTFTMNNNCDFDVLRVNGNEITTSTEGNYTLALANNNTEITLTIAEVTENITIVITSAN